MNVERAKELLPVIQAFADGKEIECRVKGKDVWSVQFYPTWIDDRDYRIKQEPKYRPFKDVDECWEEMQKHQPFGWIKPNIGKEHYAITFVQHGKYINIKINESFYTFQHIFEKYTFADGSIFGKSEE